jgi:hypothetical protein
MEIADRGQMQVGPLAPRQRYLQRLTALEAERSTWLAHWIELSDYIFPRRFRYLYTDRNKGTKRNDKIINSKPTVSVRILAAGKMAGLTSPARPWARFTITDPLLAEDDEVKGWLQICERVFYETLAKSNLYNCLHEIYGIQATFATAAFYIEEDDEDDVRGYVFPIGQFCAAATAKQRIDTLYRKFSMTVGQMVEEFGEKNCSPTVREAYRQGNYDQWRVVVHVIEPNRGREPRYADAKNMPFRSCWFEYEADQTHQEPLRVGGYEEFPVMVARWFVTGEDVYGSGSPGMETLGDCKALQLAERRKAQTVDKIVNPPMQAPASMRAQRLSLLPGDNNFVPDGQQGQFKPAIEVNPAAIPAQKDVIKEHEYRIGEGFYTNLFQMMLEDDRQQPSTAREINERHEEKMLQLGPVVERDEDELLDPMVNRVMAILQRKGKVPPPPAKLRGQRVKVEYTSVMAQAQKLLGTAAIERFTSFIGSTSAVKKQILDIMNEDEIAREYAKMLGVPVNCINTQEVVAKIREAAAQQAQAQQSMQALGGMAQAAKAASGAEVTDTNLLGRLMNGAGAGGGPLQ